MEQLQLEKREAGVRGIGTTLAELKLKMAGHLIDQAGRSYADEVYSIMSESKVGSNRRAELMDKLRLVFSIS